MFLLLWKLGDYGETPIMWSLWKKQLVTGRTWLITESWCYQTDAIFSDTHIFVLRVSFQILTRCIGSDFRFLTKGPTICCDSGCVYLPRWQVFKLIEVDTWIQRRAPGAATAAVQENLKRLHTSIRTTPAHCDGVVGVVWDDWLHSLWP